MNIDNIPQINTISFSRLDRSEGYEDRIGNQWMSDEEKEARLQWYTESVNNFDFRHPVCPKCNNFTFFGVVVKEKSWQYYHCACGFQVHRPLKSTK
jgi:ribosomal protein S27AE